MKLDARKYREALSKFGPKAAIFFTPPPKFRRWLEQKRLPRPLIRFLVANSLRSIVPFPGGSGGMWTPARIMIGNDEEPTLLDNGLFALGSAINGDIIVVDLTEDRVGFVSHDELWEHAPTNVRDIFVPVDQTLHEMLAGISLELWEWMAGTRTSRNYPVDYSSALVRGQRH